MLDVRPIVRDEVLYVSADPERTARPATIERLASAPLVFYDADAAENDPIRRQLAERAQADGVDAAPARRGRAPRPRAAPRRRGRRRHLPAQRLHADPRLSPAGLTTVRFKPALHDTFAVITRRAARLSPATRELIEDLEEHMRAVAETSGG